MSINTNHLIPGNIVFNIFQEELVVNSVHYDENDKCTVVCVNTGLFLESYPIEILYQDLNDLTVSEYAFLLWARKNKDILLSIDNNSISLIRQAYMDGYNQGFSDKPRCSGSKCKGKNNVVD